jgi:hypothetical protein
MPAESKNIDALAFEPTLSRKEFIVKVLKTVVIAGSIIAAPTVLGQILDCSGVRVWQMPRIHFGRPSKPADSGGWG